MSVYDELFVITRNNKTEVLFTYAEKPYLYNFKSVDGLKKSEMKKFKSEEEAKNYWIGANKNNKLEDVEIIKISEFE